MWRRGLRLRPTLFEVFGLSVPSYGFFMVLAFGLGMWVRHKEKHRLGYDRDERQWAVSVGALFGAMLGSKLGMLLFSSWEEFGQIWALMLALDFSGKTVVGGLFGGYLGVEIAKKCVGIDYSTGDAYALALPLAQAVGRVGCFLHGCCYGAVAGEGWPWRVALHGALRHPAPLYEVALDLALAAWIWTLRDKVLPQGHLFRRYLVGYAAIRFTLEFLRGDSGWSWMGLTAVQWLALPVMVGFSAAMWRRERGLTPSR